jgi:hypothetical protein
VVALVRNQRLASTIGERQLSGLLAAGSFGSELGGTCATCWTVIAGSEPSTHGHTQSDVLHARTTTVMTSARIHDLMRGHAAEPAATLLVRDGPGRLGG